jgi:NifU-like protein involved in Fe-S cluster formation
MHEIYNSRVIELAANIPRLERLENPDASASAHSRMCGSSVTVDINMQDGIVSGYGQQVKACLIGQLAASVTGSNIVGCTADELRAVREQMLNMLKNGGPPPVGKWADLSLLEPVRNYKQRHASAMLVFDAIIKAINQIKKC